MPPVVEPSPPVDEPSTVETKKQKPKRDYPDWVTVDIKAYYNKLANNEELLRSVVKAMVESREAIMPRPSLLDLGVQLSLHPAPDNLFCSYGVCSHDSFREQPLDFCLSSCCDCRQCDVEALFLLP
ncbi:hypothetical protein NJ959_22055 [Symplocastrum sp. BBK-W-15]|uniref:Uncharacterized protein n=1 Tax=Limnofasciculus baicalensis BBK-W-15 TaxID=2699891 RepID=A0AAE3KPB3_9CYAN|nr:hypothetical protein [Limnofasciculus baicalensis]MCP2731114.1 hypothetical protein [Limnofasciculus baicalensis BBK-W-15]